MSFLLTVNWACGAFSADFRFPAGFSWCVATSAYQVEGGDSDSDWWNWEQTPGHIKDDPRYGRFSGSADDEWNLLPVDIALMKKLGITEYRFSVEWAKIEPEEGRYNGAAIAHYKNEIRLLTKAGITPFITLHHFTLPQWLRLKGGWEWSGSTDAFAKYTELVYTQIAPGVRDWVTFNEPMVHVMAGYTLGSAPPGQKRPLPGIPPIIHGILAAHASAYHLLHRLAAARRKNIRVGLANHLRTFDPYSPLNPMDRLVADLVDRAWNWAIPDALETGRYHLHMLWAVNDDATIPGLAHTQDFIGVNYYSGDLISFSPTQGYEVHGRANLPKSDLGWDIYPEGLGRVLNAVAKRYPKKPIIITENGIADGADTKRPAFIEDHLIQVSKAIARGIPIEGYCHWSIVDNFEWNEGFTAHFGLYSVDYLTEKRTPRRSAALYRDIIKNNGFSK